MAKINFEVSSEHWRRLKQLERELDQLFVTPGGISKDPGQVLSSVEAVLKPAVALAPPVPVEIVYDLRQPIGRRFTLAPHERAGA